MDWEAGATSVLEKNDLDNCKGKWGRVEIFGKRAASVRAVTGVHVLTFCVMLHLILLAKRKAMMGV